MTGMVETISVSGSFFGEPVARLSLMRIKPETRGAPGFMKIQRGAETSMARALRQ